MTRRQEVDKAPWHQLLAESLRGLWDRIAPLLPGLGQRPLTVELAEEPGAEPQAGVAQRLDAMRREFEQAAVRLGVIGESGSGKSSLINAIVGRPVAPVGALVETTQRPQEVPVEGLTLVDLPGCGTPTWPRETYIDRLRLLESYDGFILVTASRLKECDAHLYDRLARQARRPFFVVRSHFDLAATSTGAAEARAVIAPYIRRQLGAGDELPVYMISSVDPERYDLERLILDVRQSLPGWKQVRFTLAARAYGEETLARKREAAEKLVGIFAGLAAANALNPVPGLGVSVDVGLLTALGRQVIAAYGLRKDQIDALQGQARTRAALVQGARQVADRLAPYLAEKFVLAALRRMGARVWLRNASKWVPYVGTLVSAGLGYKLAYAYGEKLIDECEAAARDLVHALAGEGGAVRS